MALNSLLSVAGDVYVVILKGLLLLGLLWGVKCIFELSNIISVRHPIDTKLKLLKVLENKSVVDIDSQMDSFIERVFSEYMFMNPINGDYISEAYEEKIIKEVTSIVSKTISPNMLEYMGILYNSESLSDVISRRTYILISGHVMEGNSKTVK